MGGACNAHGGDEKWVQNFGWKYWREMTIWKTKYEWQDNFKMDLREIGFGGVGWILPAQDR
jgi:hypothetical protein